ncbi:RimJ/RimL family protein N-acetyltransferase [Paenibacillus phyllosphaerae]|uniref:RimJ/RimL family protein N-acetyltransferase n=1 Tax=Paenibacillus phyllosphaerae TaxID=274593 RepID=A0A7W5FL20_9BACL|nr:GNAT family protein [Paenibacillus phyllosphaerae]MBB3108716.1 RimJ/RimL family protein N-acetyltransferase [Paenibacillus phyllosphaerae]
MKPTRADLFRGELLRFAASQPEDADILAAYTEDYAYMMDVDTEYAVPQNADAIRALEVPRDAIEFMLRTLDDDHLVGFAALHGIEWNNQSAKLAVGIGDPDDRGKGYGIDAVRMTLRYAFHELNLNRVSLEVIAYNEAAYRTYLKAGFTQEGRLRSAVLRGGQSFDLIVMGILRHEWAAGQTAGKQLR